MISEFFIGFRLDANNYFEVTRHSGMNSFYHWVMIQDIVITSRFSIIKNRYGDSNQTVNIYIPALSTSFNFDVVNLFSGVLVPDQDLKLYQNLLNEELKQMRYEFVRSKQKCYNNL